MEDMNTSKENLESKKTASLLEDKNALQEMQQRMNRAFSNELFIDVNDPENATAMIEAFNICERIKFDRHAGATPEQIHESFKEELDSLVSKKDEFYGVEEILEEIKKITSDWYESDRPSY